MSVIFSLMSIILPVDLKKMQCRTVECKGQGPPSFSVFIPATPSRDCTRRLVSHSTIAIYNTPVACIQKYTSSPTHVLWWYPMSGMFPNKACGVSLPAHRALIQDPSASAIWREHMLWGDWACAFFGPLPNIYRICIETVSGAAGPPRGVQEPCYLCMWRAGKNGPWKAKGSM